jgi:hypothetical protein
MYMMKYQLRSNLKIQIVFYNEGTYMYIYICIYVVIYTYTHIHVLIYTDTYVYNGIPVAEKFEVTNRLP